MPTVFHFASTGVNLRKMTMQRIFPIVAFKKTLVNNRQEDV